MCADWPRFRQCRTASRAIYLPARTTPFTQRFAMLHIGSSTGEATVSLVLVENLIAELRQRMAR
jgi:hypothetical protein